MMDRFVLEAQRGAQRQGQGPGPIQPQPQADSTSEKKKKKREAVKKVATIKGWNKKWLEITMCDPNHEGKLTMRCKACIQFGHLFQGRKGKGRTQYTIHRRDGKFTNDPFVKGTPNVKKFSADRHETTEHHKQAYCEFDSFLIM